MYIQYIHICMYVYMYIYAYYTYVGKKSLSDNSPARAHEDISLVIYQPDDISSGRFITSEELSLT